MLGHAYKPHELLGASLWEGFPKILLEVVVFTWSGANDLELEGYPRTELLEPVDISDPIHLPIAMVGPLDCRAFVGLPDRAIPHPGGGRIRAEDFQIGHRILDDPGGIPRVHGGTHEILPSGFNQLGKFPSLHVPGVVFDSDLDSRRHRLRLSPFKDFHHGGHMRPDPSLTGPVASMAQITACHW